jgi:GT2 family glycosyltransferase
MKLGIPTLVNYEGLDALCHSAERGSVKPDGYLIVDNGGAFDFAIARRAWLSRAIERGATLEVHSPGRNLGVAASWNAMLERSMDAGDAALAIANDDVVLGERTFEAFAREIADHPFVTADGWACFAQRADCTRRVGWYDEHFWPAYYEDNDYDLRLRRAGIVPRVVASDPIRHAGWTTVRRLGDPEWLKQARERNLRYLMEKWSPDDSNPTWPTPDSACATPFRGRMPPGWSERCVGSETQLSREKGRSRDAPW